LMYKQLGLYPEIFPYLIKHRVRVVHLVRKNHLDVLVSFAVKSQLGRAHVLSGQAAPDDIRVELDTGNLIKQMEWLGRKQDIARKLLLWCKLPHLEVTYEGLLRNQDHFQQIRDFLSIGPDEQLVRSNVVKIRKGGQRDVIKNYNEVREALVNSKFAALLE